MAVKLTAQQKAERGRTKMRKLAKAGALEKSITFKKPMKTQNKNPGKYVR